MNWIRKEKKRKQYLLFLALGQTVATFEWLDLNKRKNKGKEKKEIKKELQGVLRDCVGGATCLELTISTTK